MMGIYGYSPSTLKYPKCNILNASKHVECGIETPLIAIVEDDHQNDNIYDMSMAVDPVFQHVG